MNGVEYPSENISGDEDFFAPSTKWTHPSSARMFAVAAGLSRWTPQERAWLAMNPHWIEHEIALRSALKDLQEETSAVAAPQIDDHQKWLGENI